MTRFKRKLILIPLLLLAAGFLVYLPFRSRWQAQEQQTKSFCEALLPLIEQSRSTQGSYPTNLDIAWLAGRSVPSIIRTQDFYFGRGDRFFLRFYRPGLQRLAFHNVCCYHSHEREWFRQYEY
jgi:hypothetical protein